MGKTFLGGSENLGNIDLLTPQQSNFLTSALGPTQQQGASSSYAEFLQPYSPQAFENLFQSSFVAPAQQTLQRQIIPAIKESFLGLDESGSGALNRALAQSATDVATGLGSQYMNFYNQQQANKLSALGQLGGLGTARTSIPNIQQTQGLLGPLLLSLAGLGSGYLRGGL